MQDLRGLRIWIFGCATRPRTSEAEANSQIKRVDDKGAFKVVIPTLSIVKSIRHMSTVTLVYRVWCSCSSFQIDCRIRPKGLRPRTLPRLPQPTTAIRRLQTEAVSKVNFSCRQSALWHSIPCGRELRSIGNSNQALKTSSMICCRYNLQPPPTMGCDQPCSRHPVPAVSRYTWPDVM